MRPERRRDGGYGHPDAWLVYNIPRLGPMQLMLMRTTCLPSSSGPSCQAGRAPDIPVPTPLIAAAIPVCDRQPRTTRRQVNSLTWRAREALRHRCDAEEEPMSDLAARF